MYFKRVSIASYAFESIILLAKQRCSIIEPWITNASSINILVVIPNPLSFNVFKAVNLGNVYNNCWWVWMLYLDSWKFVIFKVSSTLLSSLINKTIFIEESDKLQLKNSIFVALAYGWD